MDRAAARGIVGGPSWAENSPLAPSVLLEWCPQEPAPAMMAAPRYTRGSHTTETGYWVRWFKRSNIDKMYSTIITYVYERYTFIWFELMYVYEYKTIFSFNSFFLKQDNILSSAMIIAL